MRTVGVGVTCRDDARTRAQQAYRRCAMCDMPTDVEGVNQWVEKEQVR